MAPFYGWGSTASRLEPLRGGSLLFTTKFPEIPGTLAETIQLIRGASQVNGFCMIWVITVKNIRADYQFCCFNINKLSCYVISRTVSCLTDLLVPYLDAR